MEVSAFPTNHQTLISSSSSSGRHFLLLPTSVRRQFLLPCGGLSSQKRRRRLTDPPRCLLRDFPYETSGLAAAAVAAAAHAAFRALVAQLDSDAGTKQEKSEFFPDTSNTKGCTDSGEFLVVEHMYTNALRRERGRNVTESFHVSSQSRRGKKKQKTMSTYDVSVDGKFLVSKNQVLAEFACGKEEPDINSISCFNSLDAEPLCLILEEKHLPHSQLRHTMKNTDAFARKSRFGTDRAYTKERAPAAGFPLASMGIEREPHKLHEIPGESGRNSRHRREESVLSIFGQQIGDYSEGAIDFVSGLRRYNNLLRDARLRECVDLLESMETKGFLDMEKVHHISFLKACKSLKAVKEAFRFCRLIRSPTMSTFNTLLSVCASSQDFDGAVQVMLLIKEAGLKPDCKLYTTLISTCAKSGKVDAMFEVFHEMLNAGVEPNVNTYGALIDGCAKAGQVAKAFGAYGIMRSKKVQPDRVVFNALITACGESGAVDRAFDVLAEMKAEPKPIEPDHVTVGALMKACSQGGQVDRTREVYRMLQQYNIRGTTEVYTIAVKSCSQRGDLDFALKIYDDMKKNRVAPDEMFLSTIIDVAGHAGNVDAAFEILKEARAEGIKVGTMSYSSLMGACCNAKNWKKALELYEEIKDIKLLPTVSMLNALITSLCDGDQVLKSVEVLDEMKKFGVHPNVITYSVLIVACEKNGEAELAFTLFSEAKKDGVKLNLIMCRCLTGLCLQSYRKAYSRGESVVVFNSGHPQIDNNWTSLAIAIYRQTIQAGVIPPIEVFAQVLGCLQFPHDCSLRTTFVENLGHGYDASTSSNISSMLDGFGEYDTRAFSILEEATSLGIVPCVSFKESPIVLDARKLSIHIANVCLLMILKGLKHRLAGGAKLPNITVLLPIEKTEIGFAKGDKTISVAGRVGQSVGSLLRRVGLPYQGDESYGKIRIQGLAMKRWFKPKLASSLFTGRQAEMISNPSRLAKGIMDQQRSIRSTQNLSLD